MPQGKSRARLTGRVISGFAILLILAGISLALFPYVKEYCQERLKPPQSESGLEGKTPAETEAVLPDKLPEEEGLLIIPRLDLSLAIGYGIDEADLKKGPGFYPQSGYPDTGNVSIAGHRNCHGSPFLNLDKMEAGDEILLQYRDREYRYLVDSVFVTHSRDWSVVDPTPRPALTLTTCTPLLPVDGKYDRLIVRAYLETSQALANSEQED